MFPDGSWAAQVSLSLGLIFPIVTVTCNRPASVMEGCRFLPWRAHRGMARRIRILAGASTSAKGISLRHAFFHHAFEFEPKHVDLVHGLHSAKGIWCRLLPVRRVFEVERQRQFVVERLYGADITSAIVTWLRLAFATRVQPLVFMLALMRPNPAFEPTCAKSRAGGSTPRWASR